MCVMSHIFLLFMGSLTAGGRGGRGTGGLVFDHFFPQSFAF